MTYNACNKYHFWAKDNKGRLLISIETEDIDEFLKILDEQYEKNSDWSKKSKEQGTIHFSISMVSNVYNKEGKCVGYFNCLYFESFADPGSAIKEFLNDFIRKS